MADIPPAENLRFTHFLFSPESKPSSLNTYLLLYIPQDIWPVFCVITLLSNSRPLDMCVRGRRNKRGWGWEKAYPPIFPIKSLFSYFNRIKGLFITKWAFPLLDYKPFRRPWCKPNFNTPVLANWEYTNSGEHPILLHFGTTLLAPRSLQ